MARHRGTHIAAMAAIALAIAVATASADDLKDARKALTESRLDEAAALFERSAAKGQAEGRAGVGQVALRRRQLGPALEAFQAAQKMDPNLAVGFYGEGEVYRRQGKCDQALPLLEKATQMDRRFPEAQLAYGHCLITTKQHAKAVEALSAGLKWGPQWRPHFLVALGDAEMARDSLRDAGIYYHRAVEESPNDAVSQRALGDFYTRRGTFELAVPYYTSAIEKDSSDVELRYKLGQALFFAQRYNEALAEFKVVVERDPDFAPGRFALGDLYYRSGANDPNRYADALPHLARYVELAPADPRGWSVYGRSLHYAGGRKDEALAALNRADSLGDKSKEMYLIRARANVERRNWQAALDDYARTDPQGEDRLRIGQVMVFMGRTAAAESLYLDMSEHESDANYKKFAVNELGKLKFREKKYEEAIQYFDKRIALDPGSDEAYYYIGLSHKEMKRYPEALTALTKAAELADGNADRHFWVGIMHAQLNNVPEARKSLQRVVELDADGKNKNTALALQRLGYYELLDKAYGPAVGHLERAVTINDKDVQSWVWLGQGHQNAGNRAKACEAYARALALDPGQADALKGKQALGC
jgi:tetratricopeptide (TPR) repeat protein